MINRFITSARLVQSMASQPVTWSSIGKAARGFVNTARNTLTVFGLSAVAMLALLYTNEDVAKRVSDVLDPQPEIVAVAPSAPAAAITPVAFTEAVETSHTDTHHLGNSKQQQWVTSWLSKRYRVASDAANMLVSTAYMTAHEVKLDPLLILAVMAIESGLNPFAESPMGAKGLMQVMAKVHHDKFEEVGGQQAALNPVANIKVGALILKDYVKRTGSVEGGLKTYVGAADLETDSGYGAKVLAEYKRLKQVARGQKVPTTTRQAAPAPIVVKQAPSAKPVETPAPAPAPTPSENHGSETLATL
ncbi:lytic transglycosylase domain-containing protein [Massilia agri]|uniref:Lytic transglycosylase domain-containing protein n=1 Tax=Massilia agri TaxID=1886785 RepID=A0ABT2ARD4_9BURK|nr:lytic transglycosylase domain-containing protein [Massilia agri]MCS0598813.1 lytic transglycosylase domain-containing protein [Massilia agri]